MLQQLRFVGQSHTPVHRHPNGNKDGPGHLHGLRHFPVQLCADAAWLTAIGDLTAQVRYDRVMRNAPAPPARLGADAIMQEFRVPSTLYAGLVPGEERRDDNIRITSEVPDKFMQAFEQTGRAVAVRGAGRLADEVSLALLLTAKRCQKDPSGVMDLVLVAARNPTEELARAPRVQMPSQAPKRTSASNLQQRDICEVRTALVNHIFNGPAQVPATTSAVQTRGESGGDDIIINNDDDVEQEAGPQSGTSTDDASDDANNEGTALSNDNDNDDDDEVAVGDKRGRGSDVEQRAAKRHAGTLQEDDESRSVGTMSDMGSVLSFDFEGYFAGESSDSEDEFNIVAARVAANCNPGSVRQSNAMNDAASLDSLSVGAGCFGPADALMSLT